MFPCFSFAVPILAIFIESFYIKIAIKINIVIKPNIQTMQCKLQLGLSKRLFLSVQLNMFKASPILVQTKVGLA